MRRCLATICLILACSCSAFASGFSIYEASVRANGLLGAFSAYADHVSTIYYNPAGLAGLEGVRISGGATIIAPRSTFRGPLPYSNTEYEMKDQNFLVPNFFGSYQITERFTAGIGVYAPFGLGTKWPSEWPGSETSIETSLETLFVNPAVGYTLPDFGLGTVKVGAGLMIAAHGKVKLTRRIKDFAVEDNIFALDGELEEPAYGFNAGLLLEPSEKLSLGFTYRSKVEVTFEGTADFNNLPESAFPSGVSGSTTIELPSSWVAAVNYHIMDNLTAEVDYVRWGWSSYDELTINFDEAIATTPSNPSGTTSLTSERDYKNNWQIRTGLEYSDFGVDGLTVRGGIAYDKNPIPDRTLDSTLPDSDRWLFSAGLSYMLTDYLAVDASYIFIRAEQRRNTTSTEGPHGVYNTYANLPSLGFSLNL